MDKYKQMWNELKRKNVELYRKTPSAQYKQKYVDVLMDMNEIEVKTRAVNITIQINGEDVI